MLFCSDHVEWVCFKIDCRREFLCGGGKKLKEILYLQYFRKRNLSKSANHWKRRQTQNGVGRFIIGKAVKPLNSLLHFRSEYVFIQNWSNESALQFIVHLVQLKTTNSLLYLGESFGIPCVIFFDSTPPPTYFHEVVYMHRVLFLPVKEPRRTRKPKKQERRKLGQNVELNDVTATPPSSHIRDIWNKMADFLFLYNWTTLWRVFNVVGTHTQTAFSFITNYCYSTSDPLLKLFK